MRADARAKRADVLAAARRLYAGRGDDVSLRSIAAEAGVGIATLYRHFPSEHDLAMGMLTSIRDDVLVLAGRCLADWDADPQRAWETFVTSAVRLRLGGIVPRLSEVIDAHEPEAVALRAGLYARVTEILERATAAGLLRPDVPVARFVLATGVLGRPLPAVTEEMVPDNLDWLVGLLLRGLRPDPGDERT